MPKLCLVLITTILLMVSVSCDLSAQEPGVFKSEEGRFSIMMPGQPKISEVQIANSDGEPTIQTQFIAGSESGVYLVSFQDNPNLVGADKTKIARAFEVGREGLSKAFRGEALEEKPITLLDKYPGRQFRMSIPAAGGQGLCRLYLVGTRLYQVMAVGVPAFVDSEETQAFLSSFSLLEGK